MRWLQLQQKITASDIPIFNDKLWEAWTEALKEAETVLEYTSAPVTKFFASFLGENYFHILKECVDAKDAQCAKPKCAVSCNNATVEETKARNLLLNKLTKRDLKAVEDKVEELWNKKDSALQNVCKRI